MEATTAAERASRTLEIRFYTPGLGWNRKTFKTEKALDKFLESLDADVQVEFAA